MARRIFATWFLLTFGGVFVSSSAAQDPATAAAPPQTVSVPRIDAKSYQVGPDDTLSIQVFGEPELPRVFKVAPDGFITYPFINTIQVSGLTVRALEEEIKNRLMAGKFYENPTVVVEVTDFRSQKVQVKGAVGTPGEMLLQGSEMTLSRALARAGISAVAGSTIEIRRPRPGPTPGSIEYDTQVILRQDLDDLKVDPMLKDGDDIFVPKAPVYYINGFVKTTGPMVWKPGITVGEAIAAAGGLTERGSYRGLKIQRLVDGAFKEFDAKRNTRLEPEDQLFIKQRVF